MKYKILRATTLFVFVLFVFSIFSYSDDFQYWSSFKAEHNISDKSQLFIVFEIYLKNNSSDVYFFDEYLGYVYKINKKYGFSIQTYFESFKKSTGDWEGVRSVIFSPYYIFSLLSGIKVKIEDRVYYKISSPSEFDYHRPRIFIIKDFNRFNITLSDEMRVDLSGKRPYDFYRNRIYISGTYAFSDSIKLGLGYIRQTDKTTSGWKGINIVNSLVNIRF